ncbi:MAG: SGNH/GDSL hydrolase family protein [Candidatus Obscuribacterales bacterium]|nr:SGNH/GDSL hydrolase family protein [Candidatus Obscuribacterales bacterium]
MNCKILSTIVFLSSLLIALPFFHKQEEIKMLSPALSGFSIKLNGRRVIVSKGIAKTQGSEIIVSQGANIKIPRCANRRFSGENFQLEYPSAGAAYLWTKTPIGTRVCGLPLPNVLETASLHANSCSRLSSVNEKSFSIDPVWGIILPKEPTKFAKALSISYEVRQRRLCTLVLEKTGKISLLEGELSTGSPSPPVVPEGCLPIANVLAPSGQRDLCKADILPIARLDTPNGEYKNFSSVLAKTNAKLSCGEAVEICFVGDSVTCGYGASAEDRAFPVRFVSKLRARFPKSVINYKVFAKGGSNSSTRFRQYLDLKKSSRPDLIIVEFVNDLALNPKILANTYSNFADKVRKGDSELLVCLPHLPCPQLYKMKDGDWDSVAGNDYFTLIPDLALKYKFGCVRVTRHWKNAYIEGMRPELLLADGLNHPNDRGHEIFANELMKCFP